MHQVTANKTGVEAGSNRLLKNPFETLHSPTLPDAGQATVVGQFVVQPKPCKPANREIDPSLPHQLSIVNDALTETCEHQPHGCFWINAGPPLILVIAVAHLCSQLREIEYAINAPKRVIFGNEIGQLAHEE